MKLWQMILMASGLVKNVVSGFGTTVKGSVNDDANRTTTFAAKGQYRYIIGNGAATADPIIAGVTMNKNNGTMWIVRIDNTGQPMWIASYGSITTATPFACVEDSGDLIIATATGSPHVLYNSDGTTFTPADTLTSARMVARLDKDGFWVWARRYESTGSSPNLRGIKTAGTHVVFTLIAPLTITYDGVTYTVGTGTVGSGTLVFMDTSGNFVGHVPATSPTQAASQSFDVDSTGTVKWMLVGGNITIHGQTSNATPAGYNWLFANVTISSVANMTRMDLDNVSAYQLKILSDGQAALALSGPGGTKDFGNGVTLTTTNRAIMICRLSSTLQAQEAKVLFEGDTEQNYVSVDEDANDLLVSHGLRGNATIMGNSITGATSSNRAYVVQRVSKVGLTDKWTVWATSVNLLTAQGSNEFFVDEGGTSLVYLQTYTTANAGTFDLTMQPGAIVYAREATNYEIFATISDTGVWKTP